MSLENNDDEFLTKIKGNKEYLDIHYAISSLKKTFTEEEFNSITEKLKELTERLKLNIKNQHGKYPIALVITILEDPTLARYEKEDKILYLNAFFEQLVEYEIDLKKNQLKNNLFTKNEYKKEIYTELEDFLELFPTGQDTRQETLSNPEFILNKLKKAEYDVWVANNIKIQGGNKEKEFVQKTKQLNDEECSILIQIANTYEYPLREALYSLMNTRGRGLFSNHYEFLKNFIKYKIEHNNRLEDLSRKPATTKRIMDILRNTITLPKEKLKKIEENVTNFLQNPSLRKEHIYFENVYDDVIIPSIETVEFDIWRKDLVTWETGFTHHGEFNIITDEKFDEVLANWQEIFYNNMDRNRKYKTQIDNFLKLFKEARLRSIKWAENKIEEKDNSSSYTFIPFDPKTGTIYINAIMAQNLEDYILSEDEKDKFHWNANSTPNKEFEDNFSFLQNETEWLNLYNNLRGSIFLTKDEWSLYKDSFIKHVQNAIGNSKEKCVYIFKSIVKDIENNIAPKSLIFSGAGCQFAPTQKSIQQIADAFSAGEKDFVNTDLINTTDAGKFLKMDLNEASFSPVYSIKFIEEKIKKLGGYISNNGAILLPMKWVAENLSDRHSAMKKVLINKDNFYKEKWNKLDPKIKKELKEKLEKKSVIEDLTLVEEKRRTEEAEEKRLEEEKIIPIVKELMIDLKLTAKECIDIFTLAKDNDGFQNFYIKQRKTEKLKKMNKFSVAFQKECKKANILTTRKQPAKLVGLRTKRVFEKITKEKLIQGLENNIYKSRGANIAISNNSYHEL